MLCPDKDPVSALTLNFWDKVAWHGELSSENSGISLLPNFSGEKDYGSLAVFWVHSGALRDNLPVRQLGGAIVTNATRKG